MRREEEEARELELEQIKRAKKLKRLANKQKKSGEGEVAEKDKKVITLDDFYKPVKKEEKKKEKKKN